MDFSENILAILPAPSRTKLENLLMERDAARAAYRAASDAWNEAYQAHGHAKTMARQRLEMPAGVEIDAHPAAAVIEAKRALTKAGQAERDEREARILAPVDAAKRRLQLSLDARERAADRQSSFAYLEGVEQWLLRMARLGAPSLKHFAPAAPKVKDPAAEIQKLRAKLAGLDDAWQAVENAPAPVAELKARFISELDQIAANGAPSIAVTARAGSPVNLAAMLRVGQMPTSLPGGAVHFSLVGDAGAAFFTWLLRDEIAERINKMIDAAPTNGALTDDERDAEFSRISARRLDLERSEEALIVAAEQDGRLIARRRHADPRALLEVAEA